MLQLLLRPRSSPHPVGVFIMPSATPDEFEAVDYRGHGTQLHLGGVAPLVGTSPVPWLRYFARRAAP